MNHIYRQLRILRHSYDETNADFIKQNVLSLLSDSENASERQRIYRLTNAEVKTEILAHLDQEIARVTDLLGSPQLNRDGHIRFSAPLSGASPNEPSRN